MSLARLGCTPGGGQNGAGLEFAAAGRVCPVLPETGKGKGFMPLEEDVIGLLNFAVGLLLPLIETIG